MTAVVVVVVVPALVVVFFGGAYLFALARAMLSGHFRPSIHRRVEKILAPYEGQNAPPSLLAELQLRANEAVRNALVDLHHPDDGILVIVKNDELLGPVCFVRSRDGSEMSLAEFERGLDA